MLTLCLHNNFIKRKYTPLCPIYTQCFDPLKYKLELHFEGQCSVLQFRVFHQCLLSAESCILLMSKIKSRNN